MFNNCSVQRIVLLSLSSLLLAFQLCFVCSLVCSSFLLSVVGKEVSPFYTFGGLF